MDYSSRRQCQIPLRCEEENGIMEGTGSAKLENQSFNKPLHILLTLDCAMIRIWNTYDMIPWILPVLWCAASEWWCNAKRNDHQLNIMQQDTNNMATEFVCVNTFSLYTVTSNLPWAYVFSMLYSLWRVNVYTKRCMAACRGFLFC